MRTCKSIQKKKLFSLHNYIVMVIVVILARIEFIGNSPGDTPHYSRIVFMDLSLEAFLKEGKVSTGNFCCYFGL